MLPMKNIIGRFEEILAELDALAGECPEAIADDLEDLNAELEDALLLLGEIRPDAEDWRDDAQGMLEDIRALADDYRAFAGQMPAIGELAHRLELAADMATENLDA